MCCTKELSIRILASGLRPPSRNVARALCDALRALRDTLRPCFKIRPFFARQLSQQSSQRSRCPGIRQQNAHLKNLPIQQKQHQQPKQNESEKKPKNCVMRSRISPEIALEATAKTISCLPPIIGSPNSSSVSRSTRRTIKTVRLIIEIYNLRIFCIYSHLL